MGWISYFNNKRSTTIAITNWKRWRRTISVKTKPPFFPWSNTFSYASRSRQKEKCHFDQVSGENFLTKWRKGNFWKWIKKVEEGSTGKIGIVLENAESREGKAKIDYILELKTRRITLKENRRTLIVKAVFVWLNLKAK